MFFEKLRHSKKVGFVIEIPELRVLRRRYIEHYIVMRISKQMTLRADLRMDRVRQLVFIYAVIKKCEKISVIHLQCRHQPHIIYFWYSDITQESSIFCWHKENQLLLELELE
jgi:hypothetical protein